MILRMVLPEALAVRLDQLAARVPVVAGRSASHARAAFAREAIEAGLAALERDPTKLVRPAPAKEAK